MKPSFILDRSLCLDRLFQTHGKNPALTTSDDSLNFSEVEEKLRGVIANLACAGVRKGNRVALHGTNSELHLYLFLAAWIMDFLYIPLDFKAPLAGLLPDRRIDFLITESKAPEEAECVVISPRAATAPCRPADRNVNWRAIPFRQEASAIFTSGSTGKPRGIVHTVGNYIYSALGTNDFIGLDTSDRWLLSLPLFHVGGALIWARTLLSGSACVLPESLQNLEDSIRQYRPTIISLVPAQLIRLIETEGMIPLMKAMKTIMLGGAPTPDWLMDKSLDLGLPIMPTYGCTESCAQVTGVAHGNVRQAYYTAGQVVPYRNMRIADDGAILLGGKTLFKRYLDDRKTRFFDQNNFFKTADRGTLDEAGNLVIHGRTDGVFISGGENISPPEIENHLLRQNGIISAMVVPAPHPEFGLTPWAFVETALPFDEKSILDKLRNNLPGYKLPKRIIRLTPDDRQEKMKYSREALTKIARTLAEEKAGKSRNTHLHYEETGPSNAPVIVFLHGFMGQAKNWKIIMKSLADSFRCIAFDLPGHGASLFGASSRLKQLRGMEDTAHLLLDDLDKLGIERFTLYGYSMGGRIAQHIAIASPGRIERLLLESASFGIAGEAQRSDRLKKDQALMASIKTPDDFRAFLNNWYALPLFRTLSQTAHLHTLIENKLRHPVAEYQQALNILSVGGHDFLAAKLAACRVPVYYFCGEQDEAYRQTAAQAREALPEMTIKTFKNASHNISIQYPRQISRAIRKFLI
jgi:o-succinylbenzoate---CoA ligase